MNKLLFTLLAVFFCHLSWSQTNNALKTDTSTVIKTKKTILIVPFDPMFYMSEIDQQIGLESKKTFIQIRDYFRNRLSLDLMTELQKYFTAKSFVSASNTKADESIDVNDVYKSLTYEYDTPSNNDIATPTTAKKSTDANNGIVNGQLQPKPRDINGKYYKTLIIDKRTIGYFNEHFKNPNYILFISQFELRNLLSNDRSDYLSEKTQRVMRVHYTLYDNQGNHKFGSYEEIIFTKGENNLEKLVASYFPIIIKNIALNLKSYN